MGGLGGGGGGEESDVFSERTQCLDQVTARGDRQSFRRDFFSFTMLPCFVSADTANLDSQGWDKVCPCRTKKHKQPPSYHRCPFILEPCTIALCNVVMAADSLLGAGRNKIKITRASDYYY